MISSIVPCGTKSLKYHEYVFSWEKKFVNNYGDYKSMLKVTQYAPANIRVEDHNGSKYVNRTHNYYYLLLILYISINQSNMKVKFKTLSWRSVHKFITWNHDSAFRNWTTNPERSKLLFFGLLLLLQTNLTAQGVEGFGTEFDPVFTYHVGLNHSPSHHVGTYRAAPWRLVGDTIEILATRTAYVGIWLFILRIEPVTLGLNGEFPIHRTMKPISGVIVLCGYYFYEQNHFLWWCHFTHDKIKIKITAINHYSTYITIKCKQIHTRHHRHYNQQTVLLLLVLLLMMFQKQPRLYRYVQQQEAPLR